MVDFGSSPFTCVCLFLHSDKCFVCEGYFSLLIFSPNVVSEVILDCGHMLGDSFVAMPVCID